MKWLDLCPGLIQEAGGDRRGDMFAGHPGHSRTGGVQCHERPVHEDWRGLPLRVRHQQHQVFRRCAFVQVGDSCGITLAISANPFDFYTKT